MHFILNSVRSNFVSEPVINFFNISNNVQKKKKIYIYIYIYIYVYIYYYIVMMFMMCFIRIFKTIHWLFTSYLYSQCEYIYVEAP